MTTESHDSGAEFADLLREAHRELFGFIFALLQNRADAEDVYQQTAMVLWRKFASFERGTNFVAWAIRVAQFEIKDYVKARRRRKVFFNDEILDAIARVPSRIERIPRATVGGSSQVHGSIERQGSPDARPLLRGRAGLPQDRPCRRKVSWRGLPVDQSNSEGALSMRSTYNGGIGVGVMDEAGRNESELLNLLSAVWDDHLDAASRARIEDLLSQNDFAAVELLTSATRLHLDLEWLVSSKAAQEKALGRCARSRRRNRPRGCSTFTGVSPVWAVLPPLS